MGATSSMLARRSTLAALLLVGSTACGQLGSAGDILGGILGAGNTGGNNQVTAQIRQVDTRYQRIVVQTQNGQQGAVRYDAQTQVIYQNQQYPVTALEPGDVVTLRILQDQQGNAYTDQIVVQRNVRDTGGGIGAAGTGSVAVGFERIEGQVGQIDYSRGLFELRPSYGGTAVVVSLPYNTTAADRDRFNRLRSGEMVRVEGRMVAQGRLELSRFVP